MILLFVLVACSPFIAISVFIAKTDSERVVATVEKTSYMASDTGNIIKLHIRTESGATGIVTLPTKSRIVRGKQVLLLKNKTVIGKVRYDFVRYVE